jgi:mono/diheme cytochrome c family protein
VLGFDALQLSPDRDPLAPHAEIPQPGSVDLDALVARGLLRGHRPGAFLPAPRIAGRTPRERAALGYLHGNCGTCHNAQGPLASLGMELDFRVAAPAEAPAPALASAVGVPSRFQVGDALHAARIEPGRPAASVLFQRLATRNPFVQMPALGTRAVDEEALALVEAWIREDLVQPPSASVSPLPQSLPPFPRKDPFR